MMSSREVSTPVQHRTSILAAACDEVDVVVGKRKFESDMLSSSPCCRKGLLPDQRKRQRSADVTPFGLIRKEVGADVSDGRIVPSLAAEVSDMQGVRCELQPHVFAQVHHHVHSMIKVRLSQCSLTLMTCMSSSDHPCHDSVNSSLIPPLSLFPSLPT